MKSLHLILRATAISVTIVVGICIYFTIIGPYSFFEVLFSKSSFIGFLYGYFIYFFNSFVFNWVEKFIKEDKLYQRRSLLFSVLSFFITAGTVFVINGVNAVAFQKLSFEEYLNSIEKETYIFCFVITLIVNLFIHIFYFYKRFKESEVHYEKQERIIARSQYEVLKNQVDPHFLFNSLNVLIGLIDENTNKAKDFTRKLAANYRYMLEHRSEEKVSVGTEINYAKNYLELLEVRFENSLQYEIDSDVQHVKGELIPLSIQILIENAVKHNAASKDEPLRILIYTDGQNLVVENDVKPKKILENSSTKLGLENLQQRYELLTNREVKILEDEQKFKVFLPIIS